MASILIKIFQEQSPHYAAAAFDRPEPTLRKQAYKEYKATRPPTPDDLIEQLKAAPELLEHFGVKAIDAVGYEADDIIATLAQKFGDKVDQAVVLSGDLDILQTVKGKQVITITPKRGVSETKTYDEGAVEERFGVGPDTLADYKGLVGDTSDNIPGVPGVGPKTASNLLGQYESVEAIYSNIEKLEKDQPTVAKKLKPHKEQALLSKKLATLEMNLPLKEKLNDLETGDPLKNTDLHTHLDSLGFKTLLGRVKAEAEPRREMGKLF